MRCIVEYSSPKSSWKVVSSLFRANGKPKKLGLGILLIPSGPPVNSYQLRSINLIISPKPRVTIAR